MGSRQGIERLATDVIRYRRKHSEMIIANQQVAAGKADTTTGRVFAILGLPPPAASRPRTRSSDQWPTYPGPSHHPLPRVRGP